MTDQPQSLTIPAAMIADLPGDTMSQLDTGKAYRVWLETWAVQLRQMKAALAEPQGTVSRGQAARMAPPLPYKQPDPVLEAMAGGKVLAPSGPGFPEPMPATEKAPKQAAVEALCRAWHDLGKAHELLVSHGVRTHFLYQPEVSFKGWLNEQLTFWAPATSLTLNEKP